MYVYMYMYMYMYMYKHTYIYIYISPFIMGLGISGHQAVGLRLQIFCEEKRLRSGLLVSSMRHTMTGIGSGMCEIRQPFSLHAGEGTGAYLFAKVATFFMV